jgi:uncharacterized protein
VPGFWVKATWWLWLCNHPPLGDILRQGILPYQGVEHHLLDGAFGLDDKRIVTNPPQRCYYYKAKILEAMQWELPDDYQLLTGTNAGDEADFSPGIKAEEEMGIKTPLRELRFAKEVIREHPRRYEVHGFEHFASPCFASRIP